MRDVAKIPLGGMFYETSTGNWICPTCNGAVRTVAIRSRSEVSGDSRRTIVDGKSDHLVSNQVIVIQGDHIADVGPSDSIKIPTGAQEIDLRSGMVLPGLIEGHKYTTLFGGTQPRTTDPDKAAPDFAAIHEQKRQHRHVTLQLLWGEYKQANPEGYGYSRFFSIRRCEGKA